MRDEYRRDGVDNLLSSLLREADPLPPLPAGVAARRKARSGSSIRGVYFIRRGLDGPIKIGRTDDVRSRLRGLQTGSSERLLLLGMHPDPNDEFFLHRKFGRYRLDGEWFEASPELLGFIHGLGRPK